MEMVTASSPSAAPTEPPPLLAGGVTIGAGTFTLIARAAASREGAGAAALASGQAAELAQLARGARAALLDVGHAWVSAGTVEDTLDLGLPLVCEVGMAAEVPAAARSAALLRVHVQVQAREGVAPGSSMGVALLRALGRAELPVLLDLDLVPDSDGGAPAEGSLGVIRHLAGMVGEAVGGQVALCLPGAGRAFDLAAIPSLRAASGWPLLVDATGADPRRAAALARAAAAVGADGVVVAAGEPIAGLAEAELARLSGELDAVAGALGRRMGGRRIRYVGRGGDERRDQYRGRDREWRA